MSPLAAERLAAAAEGGPSPLVAILFLALGPFALYGAYRGWTGRWREWAWSPPQLNWPLTLLPSLGLMLVGGGLYGLLPSTVTAVLAAPFFVAGLVLLPLVVFLVLDLDWFGPRWYREYKRTRRAQRREERAQRKRPAAGEPGGEA